MLDRTLLGAALLALLAAGPAVRAAPTTHIPLDIDVAFPLPLTSAQCGFPVFRRDAGRIVVSLFFAQDGTLKREDDSAMGFSTTWFSPADAGGTGKSFTTPAPFSLHSEYPQGAVIGAPAVLKFTGLQAKTPDLAAQAGLQVVPGVIIDITPEGIPVTDFAGDFTAVRGQFDDVVDFRASICAALAP